MRHLNKVKGKSKSAKKHIHKRHKTFSINLMNRAGQCVCARARVVYACVAQEQTYLNIDSNMTGGKCDRGRGTTIAATATATTGAIHIWFYSVRVWPLCLRVCQPPPRPLLCHGLSVWSLSDEFVHECVRACA